MMDNHMFNYFSELFRVQHSPNRSGGLIKYWTPHYASGVDPYALPDSEYDLPGGIGTVGIGDKVREITKLESRRDGSVTLTIGSLPMMKRTVGRLRASCQAMAEKLLRGYSVAIMDARADHSDLYLKQVQYILREQGVYTRATPVYRYDDMGIILETPVRIGWKLVCADACAPQHKSF